MVTGSHDDLTMGMAADQPGIWGVGVGGGGGGWREGWRGRGRHTVSVPLLIKRQITLKATLKIKLFPVQRWPKLWPVGRPQTKIFSKM